MTEVFVPARERRIAEKRALRAARREAREVARQAEDAAVDLDALLARCEVAWARAVIAESPIADTFGRLIESVKRRIAARDVAAQGEARLAD